MRTDGDINNIINFTELIKVDSGVLLVWLCYSKFVVAHAGSGQGVCVCEKICEICRVYGIYALKSSQRLPSLVKMAFLLVSRAGTNM